MPPRQGQGQQQKQHRTAAQVSDSQRTIQEVGESRTCRGRRYDHEPEQVRVKSIGSDLRGHGSDKDQQKL
jgi:hypothetical protein